MTQVRRSFATTIKFVATDRVLPARGVSVEHRQSLKYKSILASIREVGLIEPLAVYKEPSGKDYLLLDGHLRLDVMKQLGHTTVPCLISTDDEGFTYNKQITRLPPVQQHKMIMRAVERGVPAERIARALNVNVDLIRGRLNLLKGIAPEVVELVKDKNINAEVFRVLRRMRPMRQIEVVELMIAANRFNLAYARALLAATKPDLLADSQPKKVTGLNAEQISRMESEMELVERDYKQVEESLGATTLNLLVVRGYVARLLDNRAVHRFLAVNYPELLSEMVAITSAVSSDAQAPPSPSV